MVDDGEDYDVDDDHDDDVGCLVMTIMMMMAEDVCR